MKKFLVSFASLMLLSCGDYVENKITLDSNQETAISNFLTTECVTKNAALFNTLSANTGNWDKSDLQKDYIYQYETTNKDTKQIIILKKTSTLMYIYVQSLDAETEDRVYRYTTTDNTNHLNALKTTACGAKNTFSGDGTNSFSYTANLKTPDENDPDRTEYSSQYTILASRPVFFSLFNRKYYRRRFEDDKVKDTIDTTVSVKISNTRRSDLSDYETIFNDSLHCIFDTTGATWLAANFPETLSASMDNSPCAAGVFDWVNDILGK